jgi:hypothetical protein
MPNKLDDWVTHMLSSIEGWRPLMRRMGQRLVLWGFAAISPIGAKISAVTAQRGAAIKALGRMWTAPNLSGKNAVSEGGDP